MCVIKCDGFTSAVAAVVNNKATAAFTSSKTNKGFTIVASPNVGDIIGRNRRFNPCGTVNHVTKCVVYTTTLPQNSVKRIIKNAMRECGENC